VGRNVCTPTSTTCAVFLMESAGNSFVASEPIVIRHFDVVLRFNDVNIVVAVSAQQFVTCRFPPCGIPLPLLTGGRQLYICTFVCMLLNMYIASFEREI